MDLEYFILRIDAADRAGEEAKVRQADPTGGKPSASAVGDRRGISPDQLKTESTRLTETQARNAAKDPSNIVATVMPVALVRPCALEEFGIAESADPVAAARRSGLAEGLAGIDAHRSKLNGAKVRVAVLDTGIDPTHEAFAGISVVGQNFTAEGDVSDVRDRNGHGTHCSGTIFGRDVDHTRIGVARGVETAIVGKVLDEHGRGSTAGVLKALHWAVENKANIISLSLGFDFPGMQESLQASGRPPQLATSIALKAYRENLRLFETLISFIGQEGEELAGSVIVAACGNESLRNRDPEFVIDTSLPAAASVDIVSVGATMPTPDGLGIAPFSNINPVLCAPGVNVVTTKREGGPVAMSGTSMACPHVAGLAALWWQWCEQEIGAATGRLVRSKIIASAQPSGFAAGVGRFDRGAGQVKAPL